MKDRIARIMMGVGAFLAFTGMGVGLGMIGLNVRVFDGVALSLFATGIGLIFIGAIKGDVKWVKEGSEG